MRRPGGTAGMVKSGQSLPAGGYSEDGLYHPDNWYVPGVLRPSAGFAVSYNAPASIANKLFGTMHVFGRAGVITDIGTKYVATLSDKTPYLAIYRVTEGNHLIPGARSWWARCVTTGSPGVYDQFTPNVRVARGEVICFATICSDHQQNSGVWNVPMTYYAPLLGWDSPLETGGGRIARIGYMETFPIAEPPATWPDPATPLHTAVAIGGVPTPVFKFRGT